MIPPDTPNRAALPMSRPEALFFSAPLWASAFRPFYLLGALYLPLLVTLWASALLGGWPSPSPAMPLWLWHGHEMIFGFSIAIIAGIVLTALPSWAGTDEIHGRGLALLAALWLAGRIAFLALPGLSAQLVALADLLLLPTLFLLVAPGLLRASNPLYLLLLPILAALFCANLVFHAGVLSADYRLAATGLRAAVYTIVVLYVLKGGVLTPIFTGNALREKGRGDQAPFRMELDVAAVAVVILLATLDLAHAPAPWTGTAALACLAIHTWRVARWKGWRLPDVPLVLVMHLGFAWLLAAFALKAASAFTGVVPESAWVHAFTLGSLGMMMLGLMTRVSLRHTGRPLGLPPPMLIACTLVFAAALVRLAVTFHHPGHWAVMIAATMWTAAFVIYLFLFGAILLRPSLPRGRAT